MRSARTSERGAVTVEAAIALAAVVVVVVLCLGALLAASMQIRCIDAAREAARLTARGAEAEALPAAQRVAPPGADIEVRAEGDRIVAVVRARAPLLPMLRLRAEAFAVREPGEPR
ncbi:pilus assembly protein TadE [Nocardia sp. MDA0666]|uniref:TadE family type IV pilus minor pilin n=1 Tax=Nocardia sp. MDA0666 TaxID=2135448 RepID=UPI000D11BB86|nr:TadE family type IV pilus minor pilin [Nocardia sp. MDA0666]PSR68837.1 pilus assembly protein TadE [Nocardia sp. MDA0666]